jgi:hypothetical protein
MAIITMYKCIYTYYNLDWNNTNTQRERERERESENIEAKWGRGKGQMLTLKEGRGGGIYFLE